MCEEKRLFSQTTTGPKLENCWFTAEIKAAMLVDKNKSHLVCYKAVTQSSSSRALRRKERLCSRLPSARNLTLFSSKFCEKNCIISPIDCDTAALSHGWESTFLMGIWWRKTAQLNESLQPSYWLPVRQDFQLTNGTLPFSRAKLLIFSSLSRKIMSFTLPLKWMLVKTQDELPERNTSARLLRNPSHDTMRAESLSVFFLSRDEKSRSCFFSSNWLFRVRLFIEQTDGHNRARCAKRTAIRPGFETIS